MAATIKDVAKTLGMTSRGVRLRVSALDDLIRPYLRSSPGGQTILTGQAIAILRQLEELRFVEGLSVPEAVAVLRLRASQVVASSESRSPEEISSHRMSGWTVA
jgi:hypothetical protein